MRGRTRLILAAGLSALAGLLVVSSLHAADHGQMGETFPIIESDLLETIETRLRTMEANGGIVRLQAQMREQAVASVRRPRPVAGLTPAIARREWLFDPSMQLEDDLVDAKGNLIAARGTRVNPLDHVALGQDLIFVDGTDPAQIDWAVTTYSAAKAKVIFVSGSPFDAMKPYQRRFWFDQGGQLTARFGIRHTPAVVTGAPIPNGIKALKVSEVPLSRKGRPS